MFFFSVLNERKVPPNRQSRILFWSSLEDITASLDPSKASSIQDDVKLLLLNGYKYYRGILHNIWYVSSEVKSNLS